MPKDIEKKSIDRATYHQISLFNTIPQQAKQKYRYQYILDKMFFSLSPNKADCEAIRRAKPKHILMSYGTWKDNKSGAYEFGNFIESLWVEDYKPLIMLDSGAYSFSTQDLKTSLEEYREGIEDTYEEDMSLEDLIYDFNRSSYYGGFDIEEGTGYEVIDYILFIYKNSKYIDYVVSLDDIYNEKTSLENFLFYKGIGVSTIPTYHIGDSEELLKRYIEEGATYIGLGGLVPFIKNGGPGIKQKAIYWVNEILYKYPDIKFHLFGTQDNQILDKLLPNLCSADGTAWIFTAGCRYDRNIEGDKIRKAVENILRKEIFNNTIEYEVSNNTMKNQMVTRKTSQNTKRMLENEYCIGFF